MITLYLIRHGVTGLNKPGFFFGNTDEDLNELGIEQCKALSQVLSDVGLDAIISSPMKRCINSAAYIFPKKGLPVYAMDELKEMDFGIWEGRHYDEIAKIYPKEWEQGITDWKDMSPIQGESFRQFYGRVCDGLDKILKHYSGKKIAVVTHGGCMRVMMSKLLKLNEDGFWNFYFEHGKYSLMEVEEGYCTIRKVNSMD